MTLGLPRGIVRVVEYSREWPKLFAVEAARIQAALDTRVLDIQHVGSTSVPGLAAKPILDIAVGVGDFYAAFACVPLLEALGYEYRGEFGIARRHYFVKGDPVQYHLHMLEVDSADWQDTIRFRDYLRAHREAVQEYAELKRRLAAEYPADREAYLAGKTEFVRGILRREA